MALFTLDTNEVRTTRDDLINQIKLKAMEWLVLNRTFNYHRFMLWVDDKPTSWLTWAATETTNRLNKLRRQQQRWED